ncbi:MAG: hypothetical protein KKB37_13095 [Alphaproteobacteria bacterium]|nr:hypothetical protein [Alphaproteobacteria bacterium]
MKRLRSCQRGTVAIVFAVTAVPLIVGGGVAIDYGLAAYAKSSLQAAADGAALSAANKLVGDNKRAAVATSVFQANAAASAIIQSATPTVNYANGVVSVTSTLPVPTHLTRILGIDTIDVSVSSQASIGKSYSSGAAPCVIALSETASDAFYVNGITHFEAVNCGVYVNSGHAQSIRSVGASAATASLFCTPGDAVVNDNFFPLPVTDCSKVPDPFAKLAAPASDACDGSEKGTSVKKGAHTLSPGTYCGGLELMAQSVVTFEPGIYVVKNGPLVFRSGSASMGSGVGFYLQGTGALLKVNGGADADLSAPASGPMAGIIAAQDKTSNAGDTSIIQGGGTVRIVGALYFPSQTFEVSGNGDLGQLTAAWAIVADKVNLSGNGQIRIEASFPAAGLPTVVTLPQNVGPRILF